MAARKQFLLRVDPKLWAEVEKWAADELRSANAQVEYILREAVRRRTGHEADAEAVADAGAAAPGRGGEAPPG